MNNLNQPFDMTVYNVPPNVKLSKKKRIRKKQLNKFKQATYQDCLVIGFDVGHGSNTSTITYHQTIIIGG